MVELFLQEASEHLQFLREYSGILQDPYPLYEDIERLYISAHGVAGTGGTYGYSLFHEVAGKVAHIFQYAMNATISPEATAPLVEFIYEAIAVLESDLLMVSAKGTEAAEEIASFKQRYPFAFPPPTPADEEDVFANLQLSPEARPQSRPAAKAQAPAAPAATAPAAVTPAVEPAAPAPAAAASAPAPEETAPAVQAAEPARLEEPLEEPLAEPLVEPLEAALSSVEPLVPIEPMAVAEVASSPDDRSTTENLASESPAHAVSVPPPEVAPPAAEVAPAVAEVETVPELEPDDALPPEVLEFFVPEVEEHLQTVTDCLLKLETHPTADDINRLFRAVHTIKGSAAQVGAQRIATIAHRAEDLVGRLRDEELQASATVIDLCLEMVDVLKKTIYRQWESEKDFQQSARSLMARLQKAGSEAVPEPAQVVAPPVVAQAATVPTSIVATAEEPLSAASVEMHAAALVSAPAAPVLPGAVASAARPVTAEEKTLAEATAEGKPEAAEVLSDAAAISRTPVGMAQSKSVRIALDRLDRMMNAVGELVINRTRMLGRLAELEKLAEVLNFSKGRMSDKVAEFQDKYEFSRIGNTPLLPSTQWPVPMQDNTAFNGLSFSGGGTPPAFGAPLSSYAGYGTAGVGSSFASTSEFSELEMDRYDDFGILSRSLTEISADISEVLSQLDGFVRRVDGDIDEFTKLAHRLQDEITQARMVPIGNLYTRIARTVRDSAKASNKQVELSLAGAETELDNNIIQQLADPLLHLVRNAVAHGIEPAEERYEGGKPDQGNISVRAYHKGNHIYVEVEDDGRGVDFEQVKATAVENGLVPPDQAKLMNRRELLDLLFRPGFSTAPRRTELAGRGVGLDVVRSNINSLNGEIEVETEKGIGTRFTLKVPLTLIISQALFVQCGEQLFAFPLGFVEEIRRVRPSEIEDVGGKLITRVRDVLTEVVRFDEALQLPRLEPQNGYLRLVLVNVGGRQVGVVVEEVLRKDEIVIKNLGEYLRSVKLFPGATIAPDGSLILLVDLNRLIMGESIERRPLATALAAARIFQPGAVAVAHGEIPQAAVDQVEREKLVVLADDSISVRKFVGRMLEKAGYRVKLASDGLEALEIATSNPVDLVITDLEMPRTNGYELMLHLRQTASTSKVPVMVVTSRAGAKHRERAIKEGAAAFLVKPVQEETFIAQVVELIGTSGQSIPAPTVQ
jgi:chemosensory pili system protein ChpA (sensor histidine kinase/response regulator)